MADYVIQMLGSVEVVDGLSLAFGILPHNFRVVHCASAESQNLASMHQPTSTSRVAYGGHYRSCDID